MKIDPNQYEAILESSPNMVWRANTQKECDYFNNTWLRFTGKAMEEEVGLGWLEGVHPEDKERCLKTFSEAFDQRIPFNMEYRLRRYDGQYRWINDRGTPSFNSEKVFLGYVGSCMDIDEKVEGRMLKEIAKQEQLKLISDVASGLAHEIRNPLTTVRGFLQMLTQQEKSSSFREYFELMLSEIDKANKIMTNFLYLDLNKAYKLKTGDLNDLVLQVLPHLEKYSQQKRIRIVVEKNRLPLLLLDEKEIGMLIFNLAINGIEAMDSGQLSIRTYLCENAVVLEVQDQGNGIEQNILKSIGKPFVTTKANKVGIGLAMCYSIARRHNAEINYRSSDRGTTFYVYFKKLANEASYSDSYRVVASTAM